MKSFLAFLAVIAVIGVFWLVNPWIDRHTQNQEDRLVASLNLVEDAIVSTSADILRVDLFSPLIEPLAGDGRWKLTGIVETQNSAGKPVDLRFAAAIAYTCTPYEMPDCGKVQTLTIEGTPLVVDGTVIADLQSVLNAVAASTSPPPGTTETVPGEAPGVAPDAAGTTSPLPAPHTEAPAAPTSATEAPAPMVATQTPEPAPAEAEPIQGDRVIFLVQKRLRELGFDPGPVDGRVGPRTTTAIQDYQGRSGLPVDGQPSAALLDSLTHATAPVTQ